MSVVRRAAALYFAFQGVAVLGWWVLLLTAPVARRPYLIPGGSETQFLAFLLPDLILIGIGSLAGSALCARRNDRAAPVLWTVTGAVSYGSLYCLFLSLLTDAAWLGVVLMLPAMLLSATFAAALSAGAPFLFREAAPAGLHSNLIRTALQILVVWGVFLVLVPLAIVHVESRLGIQRVHFPAQLAIAGAFFLAVSALNLWTGYTMTRYGLGTPLPLAGPRRLVLSGPYGYVRNPMAMAGLGQGAAVALGLGSPLVLAYIAVGAVIWHFLARPLEEEDLARRFGHEYECYQREVRCWWPRRRPYRCGDAKGP